MFSSCLTHLYYRLNQARLALRSHERLLRSCFRCKSIIKKLIVCSGSWAPWCKTFPEIWFSVLNFHSQLDRYYFENISSMLAPGTFNSYLLQTVPCITYCKRCICLNDKNGGCIAQTFSLKQRKITRTGQWLLTGHQINKKKQKTAQVQREAQGLELSAGDTRLLYCV